MLVYCEKYNQFRSDLIDTLEGLCSTLQHKCNIKDNVQLLLAPTNEYGIKKRDSLIVKDAPFQFISSTGRKL